MCRMIRYFAYSLVLASHLHSIAGLSLDSLSFKPTDEPSSGTKILTFSGSRVLSKCGVSKVSCIRGGKLSQSTCSRFRCCWNEELSTCTRPTLHIIKLQTECVEGLGDPPKCGPIHCPALEPGANTDSLTCSDPTRYGSVCNTVCSVGHAPSTAAGVTCTGDGSTMDGHWEPAQPECEITTCTAPSAVTGSTFNCIGEVEYGDTCELRCHAGYTGAKMMSCDQHTTNAATSSWDDDAACTITQCESPSDVTGSTYSCTGGVDYGGTCELTCGASYTGARTLTCNQHNYNDATSTWDDDSPCVLVQCQAPADTAGGTFTCAGSPSTFGDTCNLDCDSSSGYSGDTEITCNQDNGDGTATWDATPICTLMICAAPTVPAGGTMSCDGSTTAWEGECTLECDADQGYQGDKTLTCNTDNGDGTVGWDSAVECTLMQCEPPIEIDNGVWDCAGTNTDFGSTCTLRCDIANGYVGDEVETCSGYELADYSWDDYWAWIIQPACTILTCEEPPAASGTIYSCAGGTTDFGGTCTITCDPLHVNPQVTMTCNALNDDNTAATWDTVATCSKECLHGSGVKTHYKGTVNQASDGTPCLNWNHGDIGDMMYWGPYQGGSYYEYSNTYDNWIDYAAFEHRYDDDDTTTETHNYCRNPNNDGNGPWCFVTWPEDLNIDYYNSDDYNLADYIKYCDIPTKCDEDPIKCSEPTPSTGTIFSCAGSESTFGATCEVSCESGWTNGITGTHTITCNVDNHDLTTASWDEMPICYQDQCYKGIGYGQSYGGDVNYAENGKKCVQWDWSYHTYLISVNDGMDYLYDYSDQLSLIDDEETNACRNPTNDPNGPYCFTFAGNVGSYKWKPNRANYDRTDFTSYCDIPKCASGNQIICPAPTASTGSILSCDGVETEFGGTCELTCEDGYAGAHTLTCNRDLGDGTNADWDLTPACHRLPDCYRGNGFRGNYLGYIDHTADKQLCVPWSYSHDDLVEYRDDGSYDAVSYDAIEYLIDEEPSGIDNHNYCRNPTNDPMGPWCFVAPDWLDYGRRYKKLADYVTYCNVPRCDDDIKCPEPSASTGSIYSCAGSETTFGGTCELSCDTGYVNNNAGSTMTCNVDSGTAGAAAGWDETLSCDVE